jgi:uncharacterized protein YukE
MAEKFDVSARLAEGRQAVDNVQNYVWACHLLGYHNADLTLHAAQVRDWYSSEDGLNLRALDADCAALDAVASAADSALQLQNDQLAALADAWQGSGAEASRDFLRRHGEASGAAAHAVRTAADTLAALRENLWHVVDGKAAAAVAIDDRHQAQRGEWLAAAQTVTTGAGDRAVASELIDQQVKPVVDNDIRAEWLTAMQSSMASVAESYDAATGQLATGGVAVFAVPGDLGPSWTPPPSDSRPAEAPASDRGGGVTTSPAAVASPAPVWSPPASPMPTAFAPAAAPWAAPMTESAAAPPAPAASAPPAMPTMPSMPSLGDLGGGLAGLGQRLADTLGGLFSQPDNGLSGPPGVDMPPAGEDVPADKPAVEEPKTEPKDGAAPADPAEKDKPATEAKDGCKDLPAEQATPVEPEPDGPAPTPAPTPPPPLPPVEPPPGPAPDPAQTPCEIAADALPQAGQ